MVERISAVLNEDGSNDVLMNRVAGVGLGSFQDLLRAAWWSLFGSSAELKALRRHLNEFRPDIVLVQNLYPKLSSKAIRIIRESGTPIVMRLANYRLFCPVGTAARKGEFCSLCEGKGVFNAVKHNCAGTLAKSIVYALRHKIHNKPVKTIDGFIAQTEYQKNSVQKVAGVSSPVWVIPNMVSGGDFVSSDEQKWLQMSSLKIAFVGRRSLEKGFDTFLDLARRNQTWQFHAIGTSSNDSNLQCKGLPNVLDHGFVDNKEIVRILSGCHAIVIPSRWPEGMPNVALDAFKANCIVLMPSLGAMPEVVSYGMHGVVVSNPTVESFQSALSFVQARPALAKAVAHRASRMVYRRHGEAGYLGRLKRALGDVRRRSEPSQFR